MIQTGTQRESSVQMCHPTPVTGAANSHIVIYAEMAGRFLFTIARITFLRCDVGMFESICTPVGSIQVE